MKKAVFLDRDGVINEVLTRRVKFVNNPKDFHLIEGVGTSIKSLNDAGILVFVVTNQGGVGLGYLKEKMLQSIHEKMKKDLLKYKATLDDIAYCTHKPNQGCLCRKPEANMLLQLAEKYHINLPLSIMVGDREPDIKAGKKAGCKTILVHQRTSDCFGADASFPSLNDAIPWILEQMIEA
ncbi:histidinol-phosphatase [Bacillus sp. TS-2]|nr:histidinol-phosphatase [Bacillus sp. TS-2]